MTYKKIVDDIKELPWSSLDPLQIVYMSAYTALEFAASLRCALMEYPNDLQLVELAKGELETHNLSYSGYKEKGDHAAFLWFFINQIESPNLEKINARVKEKWEKYNSTLSAMTQAERAMTVFSREKELPEIFKRILESHDWESHDLGFYKYYLETHINLDSCEGGHADLIKSHKLDSDVLTQFYDARYKFYT